MTSFAGRWTKPRPCTGRNGDRPPHHETLVVDSLLPTFLVLPRNKVARHILSSTRAAAIAAIVSIDAPGQRRPPGFQNVPRRLRLEFEDVTDPAAPTAPTIEDIRRLVAFASAIRGVPTVLENATRIPSSLR